jgi:hypothetical protein
VWRDALQQQATLNQRLAHQCEVELFKVSNPTVNKF